MFWAAQNLVFRHTDDLKIGIEMNQKINKGGRPNKDITQKKSYRITIKMDTQQYYCFKGIALQSKVTMTECARILISNGYVKERISKEHLDLVRQLIGMANNLNQIAKQANTFGYSSVESEYSNLVSSVVAIINQIGDDR